MSTYFTGRRDLLMAHVYQPTGPGPLQHHQHFCLAIVPWTRELCVEQRRPVAAHADAGDRVGADNITANAISPGPFLTELTQAILDNPEAYRRFRAHVPLGRFAQPHEIVTACLFLASPASTYVTGAEIVVDGGWLTT